MDQEPILHIHDEDAVRSGGDSLSANARTESQSKAPAVTKASVVVLAVLVVALAVGAVLCVLQAAWHAQHAEIIFAAQSDPVLPDKEQQKLPRGEASSEVVDLVSLFGLDLDQAVDEMGRGATVQSLTPMNSDAYSTQAVVVLTDEPGDADSGTPVVTLRFDGAGQVVWASYEAPLGNLGYRAISFPDAVERLDVLQDALHTAGLAQIQPDEFQLPDDRTLYARFADDLETVLIEELTFGGEGEAEGAVYDWSGTLSFDYRGAVESGNLADTLRTLRISISR